MDFSSDQADAPQGVKRRARFSPQLREEVRKVVIEEENSEENKTPYIVFLLESLLWIVMAVLVVIYTNFLEEIKSSPLVNRFYFNIGIAFLLVFASCGFYAVCWCSWLKGDHEWKSVPSYFFPGAAISVSAGLVFTTIGLWSLWSWLTPVIVFIIMMGACMPFTIL